MPNPPSPNPFRRRTFLLGALALLAALLPACARDPEPSESRAVRVVVSIPPLEGLVRELAPNADITTLVPPGVSEHGFEISPAAIAATGAADLVVLVGAGLEPQVDRLLFAQGERDGRSVIRFGEVVGVAADPHAGHDHGPGEEHHHDHSDLDSDPHLWLDPVLVERFVPALSQALMSAMIRAGDQSAAATLEAHTAHLLARVREIHEQHETRLEPFRGKAIVTQHAAFGRLAARYHLEIAAVLRAGEMSEPTPAVIAQVAALAREKGVKAIFAEPQSSSADARRLAEATNLRMLTLDPLGAGNWEELMLQNLESLIEGLQ